MNESIIEAIDVHKVYRSGELEVHALRGVDLSVGRAEMVSIMGPSGCGKTTLLNCLAGLDDLDGGEVRIDGQAIYDLPDGRRSDYRARKMGFVFQFFNLLPVLSAVENVEMPLLLAGVHPADARRRAEEMLEEVGLADRLLHKPTELSAGQQQRVAVARALVNEPVIVWADEPTGNLDSDSSLEVMDLMERLNRDSGQTFVIVTHDPAVSARPHRVIQMEDGGIVNGSGPA